MKDKKNPFITWASNPLRSSWVYHQWVGDGWDDAFEIGCTDEQRATAAKVADELFARLRRG